MDTIIINPNLDNCRQRVSNYIVMNFNMHRRWILSALAFLMSIVLAACTTANTQQPQTKVTSPTETTNTNSQQLPTGSAKRVVALSSLSADIISRLAPTKIVGITGSKLFKKVKFFVSFST